MVCVIMLESQEVVTINEKSVIITNHRESFGRSLFKVKLKQFGSKAFVFTVPAKSPKNFAQGYKIAERTVGKYMRELGIHAVYLTPWTTTTRNSKFDKQLINILDEQFNPLRPNAVWCIDTTYIPVHDGFVYLTSIMDLYSRRIIGWDLSETLEVSNVIPLIEKTKHSRHISKPLIMHSDRGSQFTSEAYNQVTANMTLSYSKKAYPWDNACIESFHALIKREWINRFKIHSYSEAKRLVFQYIETFYNTVRIHSHCGFKSPKQLEDEYQTQIQNLVVA